MCNKKGKKKQLRKGKDEDPFYLDIPDAADLKTISLDTRPPKEIIIDIFNIYTVDEVKKLGIGAKTASKIINIKKFKPLASWDDFKKSKIGKSQLKKIENHLIKAAHIWYIEEDKEVVKTKKEIMKEKVEENSIRIPELFANQYDLYMQYQKTIKETRKETEIEMGRVNCFMQNRREIVEAQLAELESHKEVSGKTQELIDRCDEILREIELDRKRQIQEIYDKFIRALKENLIDSVSDWTDIKSLRKQLQQQSIDLGFELDLMEQSEVSSETDKRTIVLTRLKSVTLKTQITDDIQHLKAKFSLSDTF